jgi:hypothetical protein
MAGVEAFVILSASTIRLCLVQDFVGSQALWIEKLSQVPLGSGDGLSWSSRQVML